MITIPLLLVALSRDTTATSSPERTSKTGRRAASTSTDSRRPRPRYLLLLLSLLTTPPSVAGQECKLPNSYRSFFSDGLNSLDARVETEIVGGLDGIGLPPLANTLALKNILDLKAQVFDELFGADSAAREAWIMASDASDGLLDIAAELKGNLDKVAAASNLIIECTHDEDAKRFTMVVSMEGKEAALNIAPDVISSLSAGVTFLPSQLPALDMTIPTFDITYALSLRLTVDMKQKRFTLGETTVDFGVKFKAQVEKDLPILAHSSIEFTGILNVEANFRYSSHDELDPWSSDGNFNAGLAASTTDGTSSTATLGIVAEDANMFDSTPPSVSFNFDFCEYANRLKTSIDSFDISDVLGPVLDEYLKFDEESIFHGTDLTASIKNSINGIAEEKVRDLKVFIINKIDVFWCSSRRGLETMEIDGFGPHRVLQQQPSFQDLAAEIMKFSAGAGAGIDLDSVFAGYFPGRSEIAMDFSFHLEKALGADDFEAALTSVFADLGPAQAMFGVGSGTAADVAALLAGAELLVNVDFVVSTGFKVGDLKNFFTKSTSDNAIGSLFLRIEELSVSAKASATGLDIDLFPTNNGNEIAIDDGFFSLSAGIQLPAPFEVEVKADGSLDNGIDLSTTITGRLAFEPFGQLSASLPFAVTLNDAKQTLTIMFEDDDLFDDAAVNVKVDFDVCAVVDFVVGLLDRLGSITLSPASILPKSDFGGIDFFNATGDVGSSLDDLFPNGKKFFNGILECERHVVYMSCVVLSDHFSILYHLVLTN